MKKTAIILIITFFCSCSKSQFYYHLIENGDQGISVSNIKNIQPIDTYPVYSAFGFLDTVRTNRLTYYYRIGSDHLTGGNPYLREYNIAANHWYDTVRIATGTKDARDVYGTWMHDAGYIDSTMMFLQWSNNGTGGDWSIDLQIIKCDSNNVFSAPVNFNYSVLGVRLQRGFVFGHVVKGDNPGEYYEPLCQFNVDTGSTRYRISVLKTTDRWATYSEVGVIFDGTTSYNETALANLGGGKFVALKRNSVSGTLTPSESSNSCATWTSRVFSNLYWFVAAEAEIACIYTHDSVFDILYECRDADYISISKSNTVASNFGNATPVYQTPELYAYNLGGGTNPSLGYPAMRKLGNGAYLIIYAYEASNSVANLMFTRDDLTTDPGGIPVAPPTINSSFITTTSFRIDITGYSQAQLDNIRYFVQDVSTDPGFSSFATLKYRNTSAFPAVSMQNIRTLGLWDTYNSATTGTTYYVKVKACNNVGCSAYTTKSITTL
jgi:hypothetical protein